MELTFSGRQNPFTSEFFKSSETIGNPNDRNVYAQAALRHLYVVEVDERWTLPIVGERRTAELYRIGSRYWISVGDHGPGTDPNHEISAAWAAALLDGALITVRRQEGQIIHAEFGGVYHSLTRPGSAQYVAP